LPQRNSHDSCGKCCRVMVVSSLSVKDYIYNIFRCWQSVFFSVYCRFQIASLYQSEDLHLMISPTTVDFQVTETVIEYGLKLAHKNDAGHAPPFGASLWTRQDRIELRHSISILEYSSGKEKWALINAIYAFVFSSISSSPTTTSLTAFIRPGQYPYSISWPIASLIQALFQRNDTCHRRAIRCRFFYHISLVQL
jgi:hypothetical protein